jgi:polyhydroxyalkanoate synthase
MSEQTVLAAMLRTSDRLRRSAGLALDQLHMGPLETEWQAVLSEPGFTLRRYATAAPEAPPVLIVPAPIKRPYIFDLLPPVSVVRRLLERGFAVYLMDWREAGEPETDWGLAEYAGAWIGTALAAIAERHGGKPVLIGHSIGGTFAAIFAASEPDRIQKLLLITAPLRFGVEAGALAPIVGGSLPAGMVMDLAGGAPGSLLDVASCAGAPEEFIAGRWQDAVASLLEPEALFIHLRVIRWTLDEFTQPARLFAEIVEQLYRADAFARGELRLAGREAVPAAFAQLPIATVIDETSRLVPPASSLAPLTNPAVFTYQPEIGVALQHVGPLVGRRAHRELWPHLVDWMKAS